MITRAHRRRPRLLLLAFTLPPVALAPVLAWSYASGDSGKPAAAAPAKGSPTAEYLSACAGGNGKYAARDFAGAIEQYRKAIEMSPNQPLAHYLLGEAQLAAGNLSEAENVWTRASLLAGDRDAALRARILFVLADLKERQKKWEEAKSAWRVYLDWVNRFPNANGFPASALSRQQVIDTMLKQDKAYDLVRQRIADTKDGGVFTDLSKSPPVTK